MKYSVIWFNGFYAVVDNATHQYVFTGTREACWRWVKKTTKAAA